LPEEAEIDSHDPVIDAVHVSGAPVLLIDNV
jgi:hypothetical protein